MVDHAGSDPVDVKALLLDADSLAVLWMNESARAALVEPPPSINDVALEAVVPMAEELGVRGMLAAVAEDGAARHTRTSLVSTPRGGLSVVISAYRLPDGALLLLVDNAWRPTHKSSPADGSRRPHRRTR